LLERDSHPLEYATLPGRTERLRSICSPIPVKRFPVTHFFGI
jgi:hypothetical protein